MFDTINSRIVVTYNGKTPTDAPIPAREYLEANLQEIAGMWQEEGFTGLVLFDTTEGDAPLLAAQYEGETVYICMPTRITFQMELEPLPAELAAYCEAAIPQARVFYACLTAVETGDTWQLHVSNCVPVRAEGAWLDDLDYQQFLPYSVRTRWSRHTDFLGPAEFAKLGIVMPYIQSHCEPFDLFLPGVYSQQEIAESPHRLFVAPGIDFCMLQVQMDSERGGSVCAMHFSVAAEGQAILTVREAPEADDHSGLLQVISPCGAEIAVSCPQVACMPHKFEPGMALKGYFNLYAESFGDGVQSFSIKEGPIYIDACREYRKEHGCEPPEDFALEFTTAGMRALNEDGEGSAEVIGEVLKATPCRREFLQLTCYSVLCCPDDEETLINVYVHDHLKGGFDPRPGDTIRCSGSLHFLAMERVETSAEFQDRLKQREKYATPDVYTQLMPYGMAHALVARSVLHWGWELLETPCMDYGSNTYSLLARRPDGVHVAIYVDCAVNGNEPVLAFSKEIIQRHKAGIRKEYGKGTLFCRALIRLDMDKETGYYDVSGIVEPEGMPALSLPIKMKPYSPTLYDADERTDQHGALAAFRDACNEGEWGGFVRWVRDDAQYRQAGGDLELDTKEDTMRYVSMDVDDSPEDGEFVLGEVRMSKGSIPACACMRGSEVTICFTLDVEDGMVTTIVLLPAAIHDRFKRLE